MSKKQWSRSIISMENNGAETQGNVAMDGKASEKKSESYAITCMLTPCPEIKKSKETQNGGEEKPKAKEKKEVERALKCEEYGRMNDLGLGRGVNATHSSPWFKKSTFQVREVTPHNIVGTEEGGILKSYVQEIWSIEEVQALLSASVPISEKVIIGIDGELSRSYSTSRRSIGQILVTRTISFKSEQDQQITCSCKDKPKKVDDVKCAPQKVVAAELSLPTFEERLAQWILDEANELRPKTSQISLADLIAQPPGKIGKVTPFLEKKCLEFIRSFSVTHYVSGIKLGAAKYEVLSEEEYLNRVGTKNKLEILKLANITAESNVLFKWGAKESLITEIGQFKEVNGTVKYKTVERGSLGEAVVEVEFQPLSALIKDKDLKEVMKAAIIEYIRKQDHSEAGPFMISCNNEKLFLQVYPKRDYEVGVTKFMKDASDFYISYNEDGQSAYEFSIKYLGDSELNGIDPIPRYLYAPVNLLGVNSGPLTLRLDADDKHSKMTLHSRRVRHSSPADTKDWMNSHDIFYICCKDRRFFRDGYICVKQLEGEVYRTCCVPTIRKEQLEDHHLLFRLIRSSKRTLPRKGGARKQGGEEDINAGPVYESSC